jgi:MFS family permease
MNGPNSLQQRSADGEQPRGFHYAWVIAALTFLVLITSAGVRSTPGLLMVPLETEFGWSRSLISSAVAINIFLFGMIGPFAARWMDRFGLRRAVCLATATIATGVLLSSRLTESWQLIALWGVMVGVGTGGTSMVLAAVVTSKWFDARRGVVMGALSAANATGQLVFLPWLARIVERYGWRWAAIAIGSSMAVISVVVWIVMRDSPAAMGLKPFGWSEHAPERSHAMRPFLALKVAVRRSEFWLLAGTFFICGASTNGLVGTHLIPACHDAGIPEVRAAGLLALMGIFDIVGTTGSGWLTDRFSPKILLASYYLLRGLSLLALPALLAGGDTPQLTWFAMFYGLDWIATVPPTVRLTSDAFGRENTGVVYGWIGASHQVGASMAAIGAGSIRTINGSYEWAFLIAAGLCALASMAFIGSLSRRRTAVAVPS